LRQWLDPAEHGWISKRVHTQFLINLVALQKSDQGAKRDANIGANMRRDGKTVLIADDDALVLATYKYAFERQGYRVLLAKNGDAALTHLEKMPVDVVFLDILMPQKEGLETLLEMKQRFPAIPVYVMSGGAGRSNHDFLATAKNFGANDVIRKPATPSVLIGKVEKVMQEHAAGATGKAT
jgi:DNA-binding NtrC family response regulator